MSESNGQGIFVNDGCLLEGSFPAVPGLHPGGRFRYRPATDAIREQYQGARVPERLEIARRLISSQVREVIVGDAPAVRLTPEQVGMLHADITAVLFDAALGFGSPIVANEGNSPGPSESG